jgi:hypothetical protein
VRRIGGSAVTAFIRFRYSYVFLFSLLAGIAEID